MKDGDLNALKKHVSYFDKNKDGIIYPWDTLKGFRAIGAGLALSTISAILINLALSSRTRPLGKSFSPLFPIYVENIHEAKHPSDAGDYDEDGRFVPSIFEEIFRKHAHTNPNALTYDELKEMLKANREPNDYRGWFAGITEWITLYTLCKDKDGLLHKDTIRSVYDGSLFERMEKDSASNKKTA